MTELFPTYRDLASAAQRIASHRDALAQNLPALKASVADCLKEIDQADELTDAVAGLRDAHARLVESVEAAGPSLRALLQPSPAADQQSVKANDSEDPSPVDRVEAGELSSDLQRVLDVLRLGAGEDNICRMSAPKVAEAAGLDAGFVRISVLPRLKALGLAKARNVGGLWCYHVAPGSDAPAAIAAETVKAPPAEVPAPPEKDDGPTASEPAVAAPAEEAAPEPMALAAPTAAPRPTSGRDADQGRELLSLLRKAPAADGAALFQVDVIAKRLGMTELRLEQVLDHLEEAGSIELRSCTLKGHFRAAVLPVAS